MGQLVVVVVVVAVVKHFQTVKILICFGFDRAIFSARV